MNYLNQTLRQPLLHHDPLPPPPPPERAGIGKRDLEKSEPQSLKDLLISLLREKPDIKGFYDKASDLNTTDFNTAFKEVREPLLASINASIQGQETPKYLGKLINERIPDLETLHKKVWNLFPKYLSLQKSTNEFLINRDLKNEGLVFFIFFMQSLSGSTIILDRKFYMEFPAQDESYAHLEKGQKHRFGAFTSFKATKSHNAKNYFEIEIPKKQKKIPGRTYYLDNEFCVFLFPDTEFLVENVEDNEGRIIRLRIAIEENVDEEEESKEENPNEGGAKSSKDKTKKEPRISRIKVKQEMPTYEKEQLPEFNFENVAGMPILINLGGQEPGNQDPTRVDLEANPGFTAHSDEESRALRIAREAEIRKFLIVFRLLFFGFLLLLFRELLYSHMDLDRK